MKHFYSEFERNKTAETFEELVGNLCTLSTTGKVNFDLPDTSKLTASTVYFVKTICGNTTAIIIDCHCPEDDEMMEMINYEYLDMLIEKATAERERKKQLLKDKRANDERIRKEITGAIEWLGPTAGGTVKSGDISITWKYMERNANDIPVYMYEVYFKGLFIHVEYNTTLEDLLIKIQAEVFRIESVVEILNGEVI